MVRVLLVALLTSSVFVSGCSMECNCDKEMDKTRDRYGGPEEVNSYDSGGYHSVSWWYWSKGIEFTFTWGEYVDGCCDKSTYTFPPITGSAPLAVRVRVRAAARLVPSETSKDEMGPSAP
jgi:hypothetical protein